MRFGIVELYCGKSGKNGFYNSQEIGLARAMKKYGYEVFVFYPGKDLHKIKKDSIEEDITVINVPAKTIGNHSRYDWNVFLEYKIDVMQLGADNQIFAPNLLRFCDTNHIASYNYIGTAGSDSGGRVKTIFMNMFYKRNVSSYKNHKCFAKTRAVAERLKGNGIENIEIAPVGLDFKNLKSHFKNINKYALKRNFGFESNDKILLLVGRLTPDRNPLDVVDVFKTFRQRNRNYKLLIVGNGNLEDELIEKLNRNDLSNTYVHLKQVPNDKMWEVYGVGEALLTFSRTEIFGMAILEAMYYRLNVLAITAPGPNDIIRHEENGYLFNNIDDMKKYLANNDINYLGNEAHKTIINQYTWDKTAEIFNNYIKTAIRK